MFRKTIVLHDYFESLEGGGKLCSVLAQSLQTDLGYGFSQAEHLFLRAFPPTRLRDLKSASFIPLWRQFKLSRAFSQKTAFLKAYDTVIYSGFYTPLSVHQHLTGHNILYCHTPPRFLYDQRDFYLHSLPIGLRPLLQAFIHYLQPRYEQAIDHMDLLLANSDNVRQRIRDYLGKEAIIVYPPCDTKRFVWQGQDNYYLSTARLDPLKRVDKIIQAFLQLPDKKLIITSSGAELPRLRKLACSANNIQFTGWQDEQHLAQLMGKAVATLYLAKQEDFGMSPVESMAAGKPVIGVAEGGLLETVIPNKTGLLLNSQFSIDDICAAVQSMTAQRALDMRDACEIQAKRFETSIFLEKMQSLLNEVEKT